MHITHISVDMIEASLRDPVMRVSLIAEAPLTGTETAQDLIERLSVLAIEAGAAKVRPLVIDGAPTPAAQAETATLVENNRRRRQTQEAPANAEAPAAEVSTGASPQPSEGRRRRISVPEASPGSTNEAVDAAAPIEGGRRARRTPPAPEVVAPTPAGISDVDLSKAASGTAEALVALGDDGPAIILEVLTDYGVTDCAKIPQEQREQFLKDLEQEVALAKGAKA